MQLAKKWISLFSPPENNWNRDQQRNAEALLTFTLLALVTGIYCCIKWANEGHQPLLYSSVVFVVLTVLASSAVRFGLSLATAINLGFLGTALHMGNLIYHSGGLISSNQTLWFPVLLAAFFTVAPLALAVGWTVLSSAVAISFVWLESTDFSFPTMVLTDERYQTESFLGLIVPTLILAITLGFNTYQRRKAIGNAEASQQRSDAIAQNATAAQHSLAGMVEQVTNNVSSLNHVTESLDQQAESLRQQVSLLKDNCHHQSSASEQINEQLQQMTVDMAQADRFVSDLSQRSTIIDNQAQQSSQSLANSTNAINVILRTNEQITSVASLITSVAEQTNLLALNAAIEAARAGEQGRGFAVVADQVRELSGKSTNAATEIRQILDRSHQEVIAGQQVIETTADEIREIIEQISQTQTGMTELAKVIRQQLANANSLSDSSHEVSQSAESTNSVSAEVEQQSAKLREQVETMKALSDGLNEMLHGQKTVA